MAAILTAVVWSPLLEKLLKAVTEAEGEADEGSRSCGVEKWHVGFAEAATLQVVLGSHDFTRPDAAVLPETLRIMLGRRLWC